MAPVKGQDASKLKKIAAAREKILKVKKDILKIIENMLDEDISSDWFLKNCTKLCQTEYDDVIQERSIELMCGYPLCSNSLKQVPKQKYRISSSTNKVYDLTERKCFCSNACYKASNFVKHQLSPIPMYMRKETPVNINLISDYDNKGSAGEEIIFHHTLTENEVEKTFVQDSSLSSNFSQILQEDVKKCAESLRDLKIKENIYENPYIFESQLREQKLESSDSEEDTVDENDESENDDPAFFPEYENMRTLSDKQMPMHDKTKKAVLITPLRSSETLKSSPIKLSIEFIRNVFQDWMTEDTMKYLLGERQLYAAKADMLFQRMIAADPISTEKLASIKKSYVDLCIKVNKLQDDDNDTNVEFEVKETLPSDLKDETKKDLPVAAETTDANSASSKECMNAENKQITAKSNLKKRTKKSKGKNKAVTFASNIKPPQIDMKQKDDSFEDSNETSSEHVFPLIDSVSQNALRRQVVLGKLRSAYFDILPLVDLCYSRDVRDAVKDIVETFSLTPSNIVLKPKEWRLISVVLCWVLTSTVLKDLHDKSKYEILCKAPVISASINIEELETIGTEIISPQQLQKLHSY